MKWQWNGGVERKADLLLRECWTFLIYIFLHHQWKQCLEFALAKLREIFKYLAGACNSNSHARGLHYLNQCNEASRLEKMYQKSSVLSIRFEMRRSPFANWIHYIATKKPQPLCELGTKRELEKKELRPQANNAQYNMQEGVEGELWEESGGGGGDLNPRDNRNQVMCRWSSQITSDYADCPLNPSGLVFPLPPFSSSPFSHSLPLSPSACYPAHGIQGCFKTTSLDKNYWHF